MATEADFYLLSAEGLRGALVLRCPDFECIQDEFALLRGKERHAKPIPFERHTGGVARDLVATSLAVPYLVSPAFVSVLREAKITGWDTYPVDARGKDGVALDGYVGLIVTGAGPAVDNSRSVKLERPAESGGRLVTAWVGLCFDVDRWDGSDMFVPEDSGYILTTEYAMECLTAAGLTNLRFRKTTEVERLAL